MGQLTGGAMMFFSMPLIAAGIIGFILSLNHPEDRDLVNVAIAMILGVGLGAGGLAVWRRFSERKGAQALYSGAILDAEGHSARIGRFSLTIASSAVTVAGSPRVNGAYGMDTCGSTWVSFR
jgi:hypothetical protein